MKEVCHPSHHFSYFSLYGCSARSTIHRAFICFSLFLDHPGLNNLTGQGVGWIAEAIASSCRASVQLLASYMTRHQCKYKNLLSYNRSPKLPSSLPHVKKFLTLGRGVVIIHAYPKTFSYFPRCRKDLIL